MAQRPGHDGVEATLPPWGAQLDGKRLTAVIDSGDVAEAESALVTVFNTTPLGGDSGSESAWFTIRPSPPTLEIQLSSGAYTPGSTVTATIFRLRNPGTEPALSEAQLDV